VSIAAIRNRTVVTHSLSWPQTSNDGLTRNHRERKARRPGDLLWIPNRVHLTLPIIYFVVLVRPQTVSERFQVPSTVQTVRYPKCGLAMQTNTGSPNMKMVAMSDSTRPLQPMLGAAFQVTRVIHERP